MASLWQRLHSHILHPRQLALALALGAIDGADIASMGLALSRLRNELGLTAQQAGAAASASLVGLLIGAMAGGRLADRFGRGRVLIGSALLLGIFSIATAMATTVTQLMVARLFAGLGIGGVFPVVIAIAHDAVVPDRRSTTVGIVMASGPLGAAVMSFVAMAQDWRWIFYVGGAIPIVLGLLALRVRFTDGTRQEQASALPLGRILFGDGRSLNTVLIWLVCIAAVLANYLLINWMPSLLMLQGLTENQSHLGAAFYSVGGVCGNLVAGVAVDRDRPALAYTVTFAGAILVMGAFSLASGAIALMLLAWLAAFFIIGAQLVTFALAAGLYPQEGRATGLGALVSVGRLGSIAGPLVAGQLLFLGFDARTVLLALTPLFAVALAVGVTLVGRLRASRSESAPLLVAAHP